MYSAWSNPIMLVQEKDGGTQFCIDYLCLNIAMKVDTYPSVA